MKKLVVNADDFGFTHDVNQGIVECHTNGILTAATLMANGIAFADAVRLSREHPDLDLGVHLVLIGGRSLLKGNAQYPNSVREFLAAVGLRRLRVEDEFRAQIERVLAAGLQPTHIDTHKHTHLLPSVLEIVAKLAEEYRIRWVRRPFDFPMSGGREPVPVWKRALSRSLSPVRLHVHRVLECHGCHTTDYFAGFQLTGYLSVPALIGLLRSLPEGTTEFMCHPGRCTEELMSANTRLKGSRQAELEAITSPEVRAVVEEEGIELTGYHGL